MELNSDTLRHMPQADPSDWINKLGETYSQVRFGPGVVGKTSRATLAPIGAWIVILLRLSGDYWMNAFLLIGGAIATLVYMWWVNKSHAFAESHPDLALLEGAQLMEYQRWEAAVNGRALPPTLPIPDPNPKKIGRRAGGA
jgi:hypothetical protein